MNKPSPNKTQSLDKETKEGSQPRQGALGKIAGRGFSWMGLNTVLGKFASFLAQIILGRFLLEDEFGMFAFAISIAAFVRVLQDGGIPHLLVQGGLKKYEQLSGPGFWLGFSFNTLAACLLAGIGVVVSNIQEGSAPLLPMLLVIALSFPIRSPAVILIAKLRIDLRFRAIATIASIVAIVRHGGTVVLAMLGFGVMSFVWPILFAAIFESLALIATTRSAPWVLEAKIGEWPKLLKKSGWVMFTAWAQAFAMTGDYLILGLFISEGLLGQYYFGYQLTIQVAIILAGNFQGVMFPILTRLTDEPKRFANTLVRSLQMMFFFAVPISLGFALLADPLELFLWDGKWAVAVPVMQIFATIAPLRLILPVCHTALLSQGRFRTSALLMLLQAVTLMGTAWLAFSMEGDNITAITAWVAGYQVVLNLIAGTAVFWSLGVTPTRLTLAYLPVWSLGATVAIATAGMGQWLLQDVSNFSKCIALGATFSIVYLLLVRAFFRAHLEELAEVAPKQASKLLRTALRLPSK